MKTPPYEEIPKIKDFTELLKLSAINNPLKPAFTFNRDGETKSVLFSEFHQNVLSLTTRLSKKYHKTHIALIGENSIEWLTLFFAIVLSDNTAVIIDKEETTEKIATMLKTANATTVFYSEKYRPEISDKNLELTPFIEVYDVTPIRPSNSSETTSTNSRATSKTNAHDLSKTKTPGLPETNPADPSIIFFTSGTTGTNKAVMLSQKSICADIYGAASLYRPHGNTVAFLPFHHAFGLVTAILMPYYYGCTTFLNSSLKKVASDIKTNRPETVFVVPAVLELFYRQIWREARKSHRTKLLRTFVAINRNLQKINFDLSRKFFKSIHDSFGGELKVIICGGAYLDPKYIKWFRSIGIEILNGYGITECSPVVAVNRIGFSREGSVGQICRDVEVKIARDSEILIRGDIVASGYYNDRRSTKTSFHKGYFATGDLGHIDKDGFLFITGRKKDLIILSNGENISPEMIESEFLHDEAVRECIVYEEDNHIIAEVYPTEDFIGDQEYFDKLVYNYNKDKPRNHQVALVRLRSHEFAKNNNTKILRIKIKGSE